MADREGLFGAHHQSIFKYLCRAVGRAETARDLTQEVFLRASRNPAVLNGEAPAWLFRVARNLAIHHHRGLSRHPPPSPLNEGSARPASQDVSTAVNEALAKPPELDRTVFLMPNTRPR